MRIVRPFAAALLAVGVLAAAGCGGDADDPPTRSGVTATIDQAFLAEVIPHTQAGIAVARTARTRSKHPSTRRFARAMESARTKELAALTVARDRLGEPGEPVSLGLTPEESGRLLQPGALQGARPLEPFFYSFVAKLDQAALRMAQVELRRGTDPEIRLLAQRILSARSRESTRTARHIAELAQR
jgi:uncharacterized protein (DUF305 family)